MSLLAMSPSIDAMSATVLGGVPGLSSEPAVHTVEPAAATGVFSLLWLVIAIPAISAAILLIFGRATNRWGHLLGCASVLTSFVLGLLMFLEMLRMPAEERSVHQDLYEWFSAGSWHVEMGLMLDQLSVLFVLLITGVGGLIHI